MTWQELIDELQKRFPPEILNTEIHQVEVVKGDTSVWANGHRVWPDRSLLDSRSGEPCLILIEKERGT